MGGPIPTNGYRSRTEAVLAMRRNGASTKHIASTLGITAKNVLALEESAQRGRQRRPREAAARTIVFPIDVFNALGPHARKRNISVNELARRLVEHALDDDLIDSILDDTQ